MTVRSEDHVDLIDQVVNHVSSRYGFDSRWRDEMWMAAAECLVVEAANADPTKGRVRGYLANKMKFAIINDIRARHGRRPESLKRTTREVEYEDHVTHVDDDLLVADELLHAVLANCHDDRDREIVIRTALGQTLGEIAAILGVTESRVSQLLTRARGGVTE